MRSTIAGFILCFVCSTGSQAEVYTVPGQYSLISDAVAAASAGDTILLGAFNDTQFVEQVYVYKKPLKFISGYGPQSTRMMRRFVVAPWYADGTTRFAGIRFKTGCGPIALNLQVGTFDVEGCVFDSSNSAVTDDYAIFIHASPSMRIAQNTFIAQDVSFSASTVDSALVTSNIFLRSATAALVCVGSGLFAQYDCFWGNLHNDYPTGTPSTFLEGNLYSDPILNDSDASLMPGSPCIDAGDPALALDPDSSRADIGRHFAYTPLFPLPLNLSYGPDAVGKTVTSFSPVFGWTFADTGSAVQTQFEVEVRETPDGAVLWSSGPVLSADSSVAYTGPPLVDFQHYYTRVRLYNGQNWGTWRRGAFYIRTSPRIRVPQDVPTIREAADMAVDGDSVLVSAGIYSESVFIDTKGIHLVGEGSESTVIDADGLNAPCIHVAGANPQPVVISGFTLCHADNDNGALFAYWAGDVVVEDCCISYNRGTDGSSGAVTLWRTSSAILRNNRISHNEGPTGAAVHTLQTTVLLTNNLIHDNLAYISGGGVYLGNSPSHFDHNTIVYNFAPIDTAAVGGIHTATGPESTVVRDNIVAFNSPIGVGIQYVSYPTPYLVENNDLYGNVASDGRQLPYPDYSQKWLANLSADPFLQAPEYLPLPGSPVIGAGSAGGNIGLDSAVAACSPYIVPPDCGNGVRELGEPCDDGNLVDGDGCDANCRPEYPPCQFVLAGDVNLSGAITSADIISLLTYVFAGGGPPQPCETNGDVDCDGAVTSSDIIFLVAHVFKGGAPPCNACSDSPITCY